MCGVMFSKLQCEGGRKKRASKRQLCQAVTVRLLDKETPVMLLSGDAVCRLLLLFLLAGNICKVGQQIFLLNAN